MPNLLHFPPRQGEKARKGKKKKSNIFSSRFPGSTATPARFASATASCATRRIPSWPAARPCCWPRWPPHLWYCTGRRGAFEWNKCVEYLCERMLCVVQSPIESEWERVRVRHLLAFPEQTFSFSRAESGKSGQGERIPRGNRLFEVLLWHDTHMARTSLSIKMNQVRTNSQCF